MTLAVVAALDLAGGAAARIRVPPAYRASVVARGLHHPTAMAFGPDGRLYVTEDTGAVVSLAPGARRPRPFLRGLPTPLGLAWHGRTLFVSVNGQDGLGDSEPAESIVVVRRGAKYGWPRCWPSRRLLRLVGSCRGVTPPVAYLEPHSSADGIAFWGRDLFVAEWGEYDSKRHGREVVRLRFDGRGRPLARVATTFATGFDHPLALAVDPRGGLLVADWSTGRIVRIAARSRRLPTLLRRTARLLEL